jgi:hypothetical protein
MLAGGSESVPLDLQVTDVSVLTTVQSSKGKRLTASPARALPAFVQTFATLDASVATSTVDITLVFKSETARSSGQAFSVSGSIESANVQGGSASLREVYPSVVGAASTVDWVLRLSAPAAAEALISEFPEWFGWRAYGGLLVQANAEIVGFDGAPGATLSMAIQGAAPSFALENDGETVFVDNNTQQAFGKLLLVKSHDGGIGITVLNSVKPGDHIETLFGPKEGNTVLQLTEARNTLRAFFAEQLSDTLADTLTEAKSGPFLEVKGVRLIGLVESPMAAPVRFALPVNAQHVAVVHAEVLLSEEEQRVEQLLLQTPPSDVASAVSALGRFTQAKLQLASESADPDVRARAVQLLTDLSAE